MTRFAGTPPRPPSTSSPDRPRPPNRGRSLPRPTCSTTSAPWPAAGRPDWAVLLGWTPATTAGLWAARRNSSPCCGCTRSPTSRRHASWRGAQRVETDDGGPRLDVDLGRVNAVHVRWRGESRTPRAATVRTQETYLWDLTESAARLLGAVRYTVGPGTVTGLTIDLPKD